MHPLDQPRENQTHVVPLVHDRGLLAFPSTSSAPITLLRKSKQKPTYLTLPTRHLTRQGILHFLLVRGVEMQVFRAGGKVHRVFGDDGGPLVG